MIGSLYAAHLSRVADVWVLTRRPEHARALEAEGLEVSGRAEFTGRVHATADPAELPEFDVAIVATKATGLDEAARSLAGRFDGRDGRDRPERPRRRAGRAQARRLAARLGCDVHERHSPRRHARGVHPRHRDVARAVQRDPVRPRRGARRPDRALGPESARVPGSPARAVVEADLQRDDQRGRCAHRAPARRALRRGGAAIRPRSPRPRPHRRGQGAWPPRPGSSCTRTRGR